MTIINTLILLAAIGAIAVSVAFFIVLVYAIIEILMR